MNRRHFLSLVVSIIIGLLAATDSSGQPAVSGAERQPVPTPTIKLPEWDVVSVQPADEKSCTNGAGMRYAPDGIRVVCAPLLFLIQQAYGDMEPSRIVGTPEWARDSGLWNIDAKLTGEDAATYLKLGREDRQRMLQTLLVDRFHMKAHMEQREIAVYEMVVAKGGAKLRQATAEEVASGSAGISLPGQGKVQAVATPLDELARVLNSEVGRPVVDKSGLAGKYDFTLEYVPAARAATDNTGGASLFTALEEQLGLKLEPAKKMMDVMVVDSIEHPSAN